ncbi:alanine racemase [Chamaesiphon sp. VAR_48_metabat_135_sub]|uniref:alanine racemase n=1 Tax=Chamaesiphon sp. VAR_48_metabat_135_sub TaxID=2964699 RepID=UPI00286CF3DC|nr:alanine racemase [Chamaesiphon sp. VAR_48_metabat_135_sub]
MDCQFSPEAATQTIDWEQQRAWVEIDRSALKHNVRQIKSLLAPTTTVMAVVKADAYGHGAIDIARTVVAEGVEWLAVATVTEGIELRSAGIVAPILILGAVNSTVQVQAIVKWGLQPTICNIEQAISISKAVAKLPPTSPLTVHLKLDTGMSRLGTNWQQAITFFGEVKSLPYLQIGSLYSHLATADELDLTVMELQLDRFQRAIAAISTAGYELPLLHLANSAAILVGDRLHYQLVRPGLILYGLCPATHLQSSIDLQPVLSVKARITQVKDISAGTGVSYGYRFIADRDIRLAIVGIGYADGIPRRLSGRMQVAIRGRLVPQIGSITMDQIMLDVSLIPDLQVGEIVTILGRDGNVQITADDWANELGTISWEILCGFKHRLPRVSRG